LHRSHIEYIVRKLNYYKSDRKDDSPPFQRTGDWYLTSCAMSRWEHQPKYEGHIPMDVKPSMGVKEQEGVSVVHCFSCKYTSGLLGLVRDFAGHAIPEGLMTREEYQDLLAYVELAEEDDTLQIVGVDHSTVVPVPQEILDCLGGLTSEEGIEYAKSRGITGEDVELWQIGYSEKEQRLLFPIIAYNRTIPLVQGRTLEENPTDKKYKNFPFGVEKQDYLYGEHLISDETEVLIAVEGMMDAVSTNRVLRENDMFPEYVCLGLLGSEPSNMQLRKIISWGKEVIPFCDNDNPGKLANKKLLDGLKNYVDVSLIEYPITQDKLDPDTLRERVIGIIGRRKSWLSVKLEKLFAIAGESNG